MSSLPKNRDRGIALVDSLERPWSLGDRSGSLVLLDFVSTNCVHCKRTIPILADLQSRYANNGLQLIGVLCDDVPQRQRAALAAKYQRDNGLNYAMYVEAGAEPGAVRDRFNVESYPTVVLLNGDGSVLWQGHPAKRTELEAAIKRHISR
jgi:thiol-disulfide isomerase/thioredoxin